MTERGQVPRTVRVQAPGLGQRHGHPLHPDQLGQRILVAEPGRAAGRGDLAPKPVRRGAEQPHDAALTGHGDRAVPVLHGRVRLGPHAGRLTQLERGLVGQPVGPPGAEERELAGGQHLRGQRRGEDPLGRAGGQAGVQAQVGAEQDQLGGGEPGLHHRFLVREAQVDHRVGGLRHGGAGNRGDRDRGRGAAQPFQQLHDFRGGPGPGQHHDPVVGPAHRHLGRRERVGLPVPGRLTRRRVRLGHEPGGAAARDRDPFPAGRQDARDLCGQLARPAPAGGLRGHLLLRAAAGHVLLHRRLTCHGLT